MLKGKIIYLRPVEHEDALKIVLWENDVENWRVTGTEAPYSLQTIRDYIDSIQNFRQSGELRLIICRNDDNIPVGTLDLYEANFRHGRAAVGILIAEKSDRNKGIAKESLQLLISYVREILDFHNLTANILEDNHASISLFESSGFELVGTRKEWFYEKGKRINERIYQLCLKK